MYRSITRNPEPTPKHGNQTANCVQYTDICHQSEQTMPVDEWVPEQSASPKVIDSAKLEALVDISRRQSLHRLAEEIGESEQQWLALAMNADRKSWLSAAEGFGNDDLIHLMKALAMAEMCITGCTVGAKSPVIYLNGLLKHRSGSLSHEDLRWLKQNSSNRFLPNGPII